MQLFGAVDRFLFSLAERLAGRISRFCHLPSELCRISVYGEDLLVSAGIDVKAYARMIGSRPAAQKVTADRKADQEKAKAE